MCDGVGWAYSGWRAQWSGPSTAERVWECDVCEGSPSQLAF